MHKIALITLLSLPLFAGFFPQTMQTSISTGGEKSVVLKNPFPVNGMSGVVIHDYGNGLEAITSRIVQKTAKEVILLGSDIVHHDELPTIKTAVRSGDKVVAGYMYNNVLLFAPDAQTYAKITSSHNKKWVHPDLFALFLSKESDTMPSKKNLSRFSKKYQVGLIYIVSKGKAKLLDPISGQIIGEKTMSGLPEKGSFPFFMRFDKIKSGWFSKNTRGNYYKAMETL